MMSLRLNGEVSLAYLLNLVDVNQHLSFPFQL